MHSKWYEIVWKWNKFVNAIRRNQNVSSEYCFRICHFPIFLPSGHIDLGALRCAIIICIMNKKNAMFFIGLSPFLCDSISFFYCNCIVRRSHFALDDSSASIKIAQFLSISIRILFVFDADIICHLQMSVVCSTVYRQNYSWAHANDIFN